MVNINYSVLGSLQRSPIAGFKGILPPRQAIDQLKMCNNILSSNKFKKGIIYDISSAGFNSAILVGDLHARVDNLSAIMVHNNNLGKMISGESSVILLGDAQHNEKDLKEVDSTIQIMQHIMELILSAKKHSNFVYLMGNHDNYWLPFYRIEKTTGEKIYQCEFTAKRINELYGIEYLQNFLSFLENLPLIAIGRNFVAAHAGPIDTRFKREDFEQFLLYSNLTHHFVYQLIWSRYFYGDYDQNSVNNFLSRLNIPNTNFFVGHTHPQGNWYDKLFENHYLIDASKDRFGYVFVKDDKIEFVDLTKEIT